MRAGSLFSGIGGFDLGFERAGIPVAWQVEIDRYCLSVLKRHWPEARRYRDVKKVGEKQLEPVDVIFGGFPCQDVSVAGNRAGLDGERSGLWFEFDRIVRELKPRWVVIENVPGLLSSNEGRDMETIVRALVELGYGVCWRTFDSQYFHLAQRRQRVFIVGSLGDGSSAEVLFEPESGSWDTPPSREARPGLTARAREGSQNHGGGEELFAGGLNQTPYNVLPQAGNAKARHAYPAHVSRTLDGWTGTEDSNAGSTVILENKNGGSQSPANYQFVWQMHHASEGMRESTQEVVPTLQSRMGTGGNNVTMIGARRLTPTECERLQGFPDGFTAGQSDSARYRQLGNAVSVPVAEWIAKRILKVEKKDGRS